MARDEQWLNMADTLLRAQPARYVVPNPDAVLDDELLARDVGAVLARCPEAAKPSDEPEPGRPLRFSRGGPVGFRDA